MEQSAYQQMRTFERRPGSWPSRPRRRVACTEYPRLDLSGSHNRWDPADEISFRQGDAVAFVTYSSVFNANPYITAQTLVLDDAHAAEGFVGSNWSIRIRRNDRAFPAVLDVLAHAGQQRKILPRIRS